MKLLLTLLLTMVLPGLSAQKDAVIVHQPSCISEEKTLTQTEIGALLSRDSTLWQMRMKEQLSVFSPAENGVPTGSYQVGVRFMVHKDGRCTEIVAETKHGYGMESSVIKALHANLDHKWVPASQTQIVKIVYCRLPVTFVVVER